MRKVLFLVACQLLVTTGISMLFFFVDPIKVRVPRTVAAPISRACLTPVQTLDWDRYLHHVAGVHEVRLVAVHGALQICAWWCVS